MNTLIWSNNSTKQYGQDLFLHDCKLFYWLQRALHHKYGAGLAGLTGELQRELVKMSWDDADFYQDKYNASIS
jgi:hypothetical protein